MNDKTCKYCKHFDKGDTYRGICKLARSDNREPRFKSSKAVAQDFGGYKACLVVHQDFGCNQFEEKE